MKPAYAHCLIYFLAPIAALVGLGFGLLRLELPMLAQMVLIISVPQLLPAVIKSTRYRLDSGFFLVLECAALPAYMAGKVLPRTVNASDVINSALCFILFWGLSVYWALSPQKKSAEPALDR